MRRKIISLLAGLTMLFGLAAISTAPAQAVEYGSIRICNSSHSFRNIWVEKTSGGYYHDLNQGECGEWLYPAGVRVRVDVWGEVGSWRAMIGTAPTWASRPCHSPATTSTLYDPPNPSSGDSHSVWIRTYDDGDCTN